MGAAARAHRHGALAAAFRQADPGDRRRARHTAGKGERDLGVAGAMSPRRCSRGCAAGAERTRDAVCCFSATSAPALRSGEIVMFDRSWYNRAGRRGGDGLRRAATSTEVPASRPRCVERHLVDDGLILFKYWLAVDQEEQEQPSPSASGSAQALEAVANLTCSRGTSTPSTAARASAVFAATHAPRRRRGRWWSSSDQRRGRGRA